MKQEYFGRSFCLEHGCYTGECVDKPHPKKEAWTEKNRRLAKIADATPGSPVYQKRVETLIQEAKALCDWFSAPKPEYCEISVKRVRKAIAALENKELSE